MCDEVTRGRPESLPEARPFHPLGRLPSLLILPSSTPSLMWSRGKESQAADSVHQNHSVITAYGGSEEAADGSKVSVFPSAIPSGLRQPPTSSQKENTPHGGYWERRFTSVVMATVPWPPSARQVFQHEVFVLRGFDGSVWSTVPSTPSAGHFPEIMFLRRTRLHQRSLQLDFLFPMMSF